MTDDDIKDAHDRLLFERLPTPTTPPVRIEVFGPGTVVLNMETEEYFFVPVKH
jgi:hypothetical protein